MAGDSWFSDTAGIERDFKSGVWLSRTASLSLSFLIYKMGKQLQGPEDGEATGSPLRVAAAGTNKVQVSQLCQVTSVPQFPSRGPLNPAPQNTVATSQMTFPTNETRGASFPKADPLGHGSP